MMIGDVIEAIRNIKPAVNQQFIRKRIKKVKKSQGFIIERLMWQPFLFRLRHFAVHCRESLHIKKPKMRRTTSLLKCAIKTGSYMSKRII